MKIVLYDINHIILQLAEAYLGRRRKISRTIQIYRSQVGAGEKAVAHAQAVFRALRTDTGVCSVLILGTGH